MKKLTFLYTFHILTSLYLLLFLTVCDERKPTNPYGRNVELDVPVIKTITAINDQIAELTWTYAGEGEPVFNIYRSTDDKNYTLRAVSDTLQTTWQDTALRIEQDYYYKVATLYSENESELSSKKTIQTHFPSITAVNVAAINEVTLALSWTVPNGYVEKYMLKGFIIERKNASGSYTFIKTMPDSLTQWQDSTITLRQNYQYRVKAFNALNTSEIKESNGLASLFPSPTNLTATTIDDQSIKLMWTDNCSYESGYRIERDSGSGYQPITEVGADVKEYTDSGLTYGQTYDYRVKAYTTLNESEAITISNIDMVIPAPMNLTAIDNGNNSITLTWTDNCSFETGYIVERDTTESGSWEELAQLAADRETYTDSELPNGPVYEYRVKAVTTANSSGFSNISTSIQWMMIAPDNLQITRLDETSLSLSWTDNSDNEEGFEIARKTGTGNWVTSVTKPAGSTSHTDAGLTKGETYTYRVKATSQYGDSDWSEESAIYIQLVGTVTDIDGNVYKTVKIGDQIWMAENLKVTKYRDGTAIPNVTDNSSWTGLNTGACCYYNNDVGNADTYGALYNWYAVNDSRNIAPEGWHVSTDAEWTELTDYLGGSSVAGKKLKSTSGWNDYNGSSGNGTDEVAFCGLPGGYRNYYNGYYLNMGNFGYFWSSSEYDTNYAWIRKLYYYYDDIYRNYDNKQNGLSVRCLQD